jgi:hypothetical protein
MSAAPRTTPGLMPKQMGGNQFASNQFASNNFGTASFAAGSSAAPGGLKFSTGIEHKASIGQPHDFGDIKLSNNDETAQGFGVGGADMSVVSQSNNGTKMSDNEAFMAYMSKAE